MGKDSKIEWTHHTFNPWWGCTKVSPGCAHCYAESFAKRTGNRVWGDDAPRRFMSDAHWSLPLEWNEAAEKAGQRQRVFCASMADVFEERGELIEPRERLFYLIGKTPWLDWLLLTKRPANIRRLWPDSGFPDNVWLGTSAEDQKRWDERVPVLCSIPARIHFVSAEPLLGPIVMADAWPRLDWVIVGGESGAKARPMEAVWVRSLRDQCGDQEVYFFFKQWGEWVPAGQMPTFMQANAPVFKGRVAFKGGAYRVGKKYAGRLLDGRQWDEVPDSQVPAAELTMQIDDGKGR